MDDRKRSEVSTRTSKRDGAKRPKPHAVKDLPAKPETAKREESVKGGWGGLGAYFAEDAG